MDSVLWMLRRVYSRPESTLFGAALIVLAALYGFLKLAHELVEGDLRDLDETLLVLAHNHLMNSESSVMMEVARNLTALGSYPVVTLLLVLVTGFLLLEGARVQALYVVLVTGGGALLSQQLKSLFLRPRPSSIERLTDATGWSFPSGHALSSAVVYLTLGVLLAANVSRPRMKVYVLSVSLLLPVLVGVSRVLLAVHYPSDVVAGWMVGLAWALSCWIAFELVLRRRANARSGR